MTLAELEEYLAEARVEGATDETTIILGTQPNYPFGCSVTTVCLDKSFRQSFTTGQSIQALVIAEGSQQGYGNKDWWSGDAVIIGEEEEEE